MPLLPLTLCCALMIVELSVQTEIRTPSSPSKNIITVIPELLGMTGTAPVTRTDIPGLEPRTKSRDKYISTDEVLAEPITTKQGEGPRPPEPRHPVQHAGLPRGLEVYPVPLKDSYHELGFNVSWERSFGPPAQDYSIEILSVTDTVDCVSPMCYEYKIPGEATWWVVPAVSSTVAETCAVRPGCSYHVRLLAHPWDGHTSANRQVQLDECVAGVCSCAHSPRLPVPVVQARAVAVQGEILVNVSWTTPQPTYPQRLPPGLGKQRYAVSIAKQMVSDAHPSPWFANTVTRYVDADGPVGDRDTPRWLLLPVAERSGKRSDKRGIQQRNLVLDVRLLARVSLIDDRGCVGPEGNATAYDPAEANKRSISTYVLWAVFGGACAVIVGALVAVSARVVKRILNAFRPAPVSAPLEPLCSRPAWFPLQLHTCPIYKPSMEPQ